MNFKNDLKAALDSASPSEEKLTELRLRLNEEAQKKERRFGDRRLFAVSCTALILAFAISLLSAIPLLMRNGGTYSSPKKLSTVKSYMSLYTHLSSLNGRGKGDGYIIFTESSDSALDVNTSVDPSSPSPEYESPEHSDTNVQTEGVMEGDVVKTDGRYIYVLSTNSFFSEKKVSLTIIAVNGDGTTEKVSSLSFPVKTEEAFTEYCEMYLLGDVLAITVSENLYDKDSFHNGYYYGRYNSHKSVTLLYDISDRAEPSFIGKYSQAGHQQTTRLKNGILYTVSVYSLPNTQLKANEPETYVPYTETDGQKKLFGADCIYISEYSNEAYYTVVTALDVKKGEFISETSVLGSVADIYMSSDNIYLTKYVYENIQIGEGFERAETAVKTLITKISTEGGVLTATASATVNGTVNDRFSLDEYKGFLRIVTTELSQGILSNGLYILDKGLNTVGSIENIAETERVYSVRFDGDICYFVTFRQIDPLFAADLSVPTSPKILSALKIPGFSTYMQKYGENKLVGIGFEDGKVKLSMFNTEDKTDVFQEAVTYFDSYMSEANYDPHAFFADEELGLIGFPINISDTSDLYYMATEYVLLSYDKEKCEFIPVATLPTEQADSGVRGIRIDGYFYVVTETSVTTFDLTVFEKISALEF